MDRAPVPRYFFMSIFVLFFVAAPDRTQLVRKGPTQLTDVEKARILGLREDKVPVKERRGGQGEESRLLAV